MNVRHTLSVKAIRPITILLLLLTGVVLLAGTPAHAEAPPPPNDDFDGAAVVPSLPFAGALDTRGATPAADDPACYGAGATVWYAFTPSRTTLVGINTEGSDYVASVAAYSGSRGSLTPLGCAPPGSGALLVHLEAGKLYHFMIGSAWDGPGGALSLSLVELEPAPHDGIAGAAVISTERPFHDAVRFSLATRVIDDPYCGSGPTVWYTFTPTWDTRLELRAAGSESAVSVYTGEPGSLTQVACQYLHYVPSLEMDVSAGETYYIMLAAAWYYAGDVDFNFEPDNAYVYLPAILTP